MCGIAGYINLNNESIKDTERIFKMLDVQRHRGPDDNGIRTINLENATSREVSSNSIERIDRDYNGVLGFNRLSILDLSINGHQPMVSPDGEVILMLNGEIYNAFDFKAELETWGYSFKSQTDTEVVLALYLKYGFEGMQCRLNGMFAIVITDLRKKLIYVTRDRFGIKPIYYIFNKRYFAFSSELKSFKFLENFDFEIDYEQLDEFLLYRNNLYGTLFKGIDLLAPGSYLKYSPGKPLEKYKYFEIDQYTRIASPSQSVTEYEEMMRVWLSQSVKRQLISDVKLGCQLSGGIDSSLVTWLANNNSQQGSFESVSIVFNNRNFSEEQYIDQVTESLGIVSHKFLLDSKYYMDHFEKSTWHLESPINHPNTIGIYKLSENAKKYVTVLLSGEGADEVFGGYGRFYDLKFPFTSPKLLHTLKSNISDPAGVVRYLNPQMRSVLANAYMTPKFAKSIYRGFDFKNAVETRISLFESMTGSVFDKQVKFETRSYLPDLLVRQDKMSMAHSIENRVPFLDNVIVENSFNIPEKYLLQKNTRKNTNNEKYLLKSIAAKQFGQGFAFRDKMGFGIPLRSYFSEKRFREYLVDEIYPGIKNRGIFDFEPIKDLIDNIDRIKYHELEGLWILISFELWARLYIDSRTYS